MATAYANDPHDGPRSEAERPTYKSKQKSKRKGMRAKGPRA